MGLPTVSAGLHPLPAWVDELRPHQVDALDAIEAAFAEGNEVVYVDAPTGSGKTLIGQQTANRLDVPALYICSDKQLQRQFMRDFPYAKLLQGRNNYDTVFGPTTGKDRVSAEDCTANGPMDTCMFCPGHHECAYQIAKTEALQADLAVLNTSYFLSAANFAKSFDNNELVIVDEADALESSLMGFVEFTVPEWMGRQLRLTYPGKGVHKPKLIAWLEQTATDAQDYVRKQALEPKEVKKYRAFAAQCVQVAFELQRDVNAKQSEEDTGRWLRDYETRTLTLKPVLVSTFGPKNLWRHSRRWLIMSATIISADEMSDSLGVPFDWHVVTVPMTFPVENRPIILAPVANVTWKAMDVPDSPVIAQLVYAIEQIALDHPGEKVLVHTGSYALNNKLYEACEFVGGRAKFTHTSARDRQHALESYLVTDGAVIFSPSMARGVDLKGEDCRVQIVAKCVFPPLGDKRISARMHLPGGDQWYRVQTVREIVQMTGRGVRSETDHATTYILDSQFTKNLYAKSKFLFPAWWREAVDSRFDVRHLMPQRVNA